MMRFIGPVFVSPTKEGELRRFSINPVPGWEKKAIDLECVRCWPGTGPTGGKTSAEAFTALPPGDQILVDFHDYWTH